MHVDLREHKFTRARVRLHEYYKGSTIVIDVKLVELLLISRKASLMR